VIDFHIIAFEAAEPVVVPVPNFYYLQGGIF